MSLAQGNNTLTLRRIETWSPDPESDALTTRPVRSPGSFVTSQEKHHFWWFTRPGPTQTGLYNDRRLLEVSNFGFRKYRYCTIYVAKTKTLISCAVTAQLICTFVVAYAKSRISHDAANLCPFVVPKLKWTSLGLPHI